MGSNKSVFIFQRTMAGRNSPAFFMHISTRSLTLKRILQWTSASEVWIKTSLESVGKIKFQLLHFVGLILD